ncbi:hypothetical protein D3C80_2203170 [compost metagenome]
MKASAAWRGVLCCSLIRARAWFNGSMGKSTLLKNATNWGYCFWNGVDTPIDSFEGNERVGFGSG